jgi:urate oxidase
MSDKLKAFAKSMAEGQADSTREELVQFLTEIYLNGYEPITEADLDEDA